MKISRIFYIGFILSLLAFLFSTNSSLAAENSRFKTSISHSDFTSKEDPQITVEEKSFVRTGILKFIPKFIYSPPPPPPLKSSLKVTVKNADNQSLDNIEPIIQEIDGKISVSLDKNQLRPGRYSIEISTDDSSTIVQDFTWGVLSLNPDQSPYTIGDTAFLAIAVLDDRGKMVCDSDLSLKITKPDGNIETLSTQNGLITVNDVCHTKEITLTPDYQAIYKIDQIGNYSYTLTATNQNGAYSISDSFQAEEKPDFIIKRLATTRIYPPNTYPVTLKITANQNFSGIITESVPSSFKITNTSAKISTQNDRQILTWNVSLSKGQTISLKYSYLAPQISPERYLLGPLVFSEKNKIIYTEARSWQIASDVLDITHDNTSVSGNNQVGVAASWYHTVATGGVLFVTVSARNTTDANRPVSSITYGGYPLTKAVSIQNDSYDLGSEIWYISNPITGSSQQIVVTMTGTGNLWAASASSFTNVNTTTSIGTSNSTSASSTSIGITVTPSQSDSWILDSVYSKSDGAITTSQTERSNQAVNSNGDHVGSATAGPVSSATSMSWSWASAGQNATLCAVEILAAPSNEVPSTPTNTTPANAATNQSRNPTLIGSTFSDPDTGDTHANSQWQLATDSGFSSLVWDSSTTATNLTSIIVNSSNGTFSGSLSGKTTLNPSTQYYFRVRHQDNNGGWSNYSTGTYFTTQADSGFLDITHDNTSVSGNNQVGVAASWYHTVATGGVLFVTVSARNTTDANRPVSSITYGGYPLTKAVSIQNDSYDLGSEIWYISNPITGSSQQIVVTMTGTGNLWAASASSFTNVNTTTSIGTSNSTSASSTSIGVTVTPSQSSSWILDSVYSKSDLAITTSQTQRSNQVVNSSGDHVGSATAGPVSSATSMSWSWSAAGQAATLCAVEIIAAPSNVVPSTPTNTTPANAATNQSRNPTLIGSTFSDPDAGDTHANSQWQLATDSGFSSLVWDSSTTASNLTSIVVNSSNGTFSGSLSGKTTLNSSTQYYFRVRHQDNNGGWSNYSTGTYFTTQANVVPSTPTNTTPANAATNQSRNPTLIGSTFSDPDAGDTHANSQWQLATDSGFSSLVWDSSTTATNLTSVVVNSSNGTFSGSLSGKTTLNSSTQYYFRVRHQDNNGGWSNYSTGTYFTTQANVVPSTPTNTTPANAATNQSRNPTLIGSTFSDPDAGDTHANSQWQLATDSGFSSLVWDSSTTASNLTSIVVNSSNGTFSGSLSGKTTLNSSTQYYFRVRHQDNNGGWSNYSTGTYFTTQANVVPSTPTNTTPANAATNQSRNPTLIGSTFSDPDTGDTHANSQWQLATDSGFSSLVWDSSTTATNLTSIVVNSTNGTFSGSLSGKTTLNPSTQYYFRVRHQDNNGGWSNYSTGTYFTTQANVVPSTPTNTTPANAATNQSRNPTLIGSTFSDPDAGDTHANSQWQLATDSGFSSLVWDSSTTATNLTSIVVNSTNGTFSGSLSGKTTLNSSTQYYFRVRHQDNNGGWSNYSTGTYFTTQANVVPSTPTNTTPANAATNQSRNPTLIGSTFSDPDAGDTHANSQWQLATDSGFSSLVWDSSTTATNLTSVVVNSSNGTFSGSLSGKTTLNSSTQYYFRVRHQDNNGGWSNYSTGTYFTTQANVVPSTPTNTTPANAATNQSRNPTLIGSTFSDPDAGDTHANSQWQLATDSGFSSLVWDSSTTASNLTSIVVNSSNGTFSGSLSGKTTLNSSTQYYFRVRHQDNNGGWSNYSTGTYFTTQANVVPSTPTNTTPANAATNQSRNPTLIGSTFSDPDTGDTHANSQWQLATDSGFSSLVWDSSTTATNLTSIVVNSTNGTFSGSLSGKTTLNPSTQYYFRVRHQDNNGGWSNYSTGTYFTTQANVVPSTPTNTTPANAATNQSRNPTLIGSTFSDPDAGDTHANSQWQLATDSGFSSLVWDSSTTATNLTSIVVNSTNGTFSGSLSGKTTLNSSTQYYFRVRHQDNNGGWSNYSTGTYFTTQANVVPSTPTNTTPANAATNQSRNPTLIGSTFSDPDTGDTHANSQWQLATDSGFSSLVWDSSTTASNLTSIVVNSSNGTFSGSLSGKTTLNSSTQYYFRVRHQDNNGGWSNYSTGTYFTTQANVVPSTPTNTTPSVGTTGVDIRPTLSASAYSDPDSDAQGATQWQISTGTGASFIAGIVYDTGTTTASNSININYTLNCLTTYYWRVRYQDNQTGWSSYSTDTGFTTADISNLSPNTPTLYYPGNNANDIAITPILRTTTIDSDSDYVRYKIEICTNQAMSIGCSTFDQTASQVGWSGQNTQSNTAYTSGTQALFILQTPLSNSTPYYWRSYAIDPAGTNSWSLTQLFPNKFTTISATVDIGTKLSIYTTELKKPLAYYKLDEGTGTQIGSWGTTSPLFGTLGSGSSAPSWTTSGLQNKALSFNGTNQYVSIADNSALDITPNITLSAWVYPTNLTGYRTILSKRDISGTEGNYSIRTSGDELEFYYASGSWQVYATSSANLAINRWYYVAATYDGSTIKIYLNGKLLNGSCIAGTCNVSLPSNDNNNLAIGRAGDNPTEYFQGTIDEIRIYDQALSATEIKVDYNQGNSVILSTYTNSDIGDSVSVNFNKP